MVQKCRAYRWLFFSPLELKSLYVLDLGWSYAAKVFAHWHNINLLDLSYNPLVFDCQSGWLSKVLKENTSAVCYRPDENTGQQVKDLCLSDFRCYGSFRKELAVPCVRAGLLTGVVILSTVHCQKRSAVIILMNMKVKV